MEGGGNKPGRGGGGMGGCSPGCLAAQWEEDHPMPGLVAAAAAQAAAVQSGGSVRREGAEQQQAAAVALLDPSKKKVNNNNKRRRGLLFFFFFFEILYSKDRRDILRVRPPGRSAHGCGQPESRFRRRENEPLSLH